MCRVMIPSRLLQSSSVNASKNGIPRHNNKLATPSSTTLAKPNNRQDTKLASSVRLTKKKRRAQVSKKKRPRLVRFASSEPLKIIDPQSQSNTVLFGPAQHQHFAAVWYDEGSNRRMVIEAMSTVALAMMGRPDTDLRGLEHQTIQGREEKRQRVSYHTNTLLDEQVNQWATHGAVDPERLAQVSRELSRSNRTQAVSVALEDQNEALPL
jgi:hypothetical protein